MMKRAASLLLALVLLAVSCLAPVASYAKSSYVISGKTDSNNRWSAAPNTAYQTVADNLWKTVAPELLEADSADSLLKQKLYTNETVGKILLLYTRMEQITAQDVTVNGSSLGEFLGTQAAGALENGFDLIEEKYSVAREKILQAADSEYPYFGGFEGLLFSNGDFGFQDGDRDGFSAAVLAVLRPLVHDVGKKGLKLAYHRGFTLAGPVDGIYQYWMPVLETLGVAEVLSAEEDTAQYEAAIQRLAKTYDAGLYYDENEPMECLEENCEVDILTADEALRPILDGILDVYDRELAPAPVKGFFQLLPRLAYLVSSGMLTELVQHIGAASSVVKKNASFESYLDNLKIDADALNGYLTGREWKLKGKAFVLSPIDVALYASVKGDSDADEKAFDITLNAVAQQLFIKQQLNGVTYDNMAALKELISENQTAFDKITPNVTAMLTEAAKTAGTDKAKAYTELCNIVMRYFGNIKRVRVLCSGKTVAQEFVVKSKAPKMTLPANTATVAGKGASGQHTVYSWNKALPKTVTDDIDITETSKKTACTFKNEVTKATLSKNGKVVKKCSVCGNIASTTVVYYPKTFTLAKTAYVYTGKAIQPAVTVKDSKGNTVAASDYSVKYSDNKLVGKATVTVTFKGNYSGAKKLTFKINPKPTTVASVTAASKGFTVKWNKQATQTTGYQVQYSTSSDFSNAKTVTLTKNTTLSKKITGLTAKKKYYVRVRTYRTVDGVKYYSAWSAKKAVTTKA